MQEVSKAVLGLLGQQPWWEAYLRSPLPPDIGRCCTLILLRKVRRRLCVEFKAAMAGCTGCSPAAAGLPAWHGMAWHGVGMAWCCTLQVPAQPSSPCRSCLLVAQPCHAACTYVPLHALQDRVSEVQWLEPYVYDLNDMREDEGFERDVKSVCCTLLGRPLRIRCRCQAGRPARGPARGPQSPRAGLRGVQALAASASIGPGGALAPDLLPCFLPNPAAAPPTSSMR